MEDIEGQRATALQKSQNACPESQSNARENGTKDRCDVRSDSNKARPVVTVGLLHDFGVTETSLSPSNVIDSGLDDGFDVRGDMPRYTVGSEHALMSRNRSAWIPVIDHAVIVRLTFVVNVDHSGSDRGRYVDTKVVRLRQTTRVYAYSHSRTPIVLLVALVLGQDGAPPRGTLRQSPLGDGPSLSGRSKSSNGAFPPALRSQQRIPRLQ